MKIKDIFSLIVLILVAAPFAKGQNPKSSVVWNIDCLENIGGYKTSALLKPPALIETSLGKALHFNGIDQGLLVKGNPLGDSKSFTIEVIFKPDSSSNPLNYEQRFLHIMKPGFEEKRLLLELRLNKSQRWSLDSFLASGNPGLPLLDTTLTHPAGQWQHIAVVYENRTVTNYINGVKELTGKVEFSPIPDGQISIGVRQTEKSWFKGVIKTIKFTPRPLKPYEFVKPEKN